MMINQKQLMMVTQNKDPTNLNGENGLPSSNNVKQFFIIYRQFYSTRESARYKMPGWFVSVGQVGVSESSPSPTPCTRVAHKASMFSLY